MKHKLVALLIAVVGLVGLNSSPAGAVAGGGKAGHTDISGVITNNSVPVAGAKVTVLCNGLARHDTTNAQGSYVVSFPNSKCVFGSTVKVTAVKGGYSGVSSGTVQGITTKLNLGIVNVSIPEYGLIAAAVAGFVGVGLIAYSRRRNINDLAV